MSLSLGHALRRRVGLPSNPLVAMQPPAQPEEPPVQSCGVRGCPEKFKALPNWSEGTLQNMKDLHMMIDHPRHQATPEARKRYNDSRYGIYG